MKEDNDEEVISGNENGKSPGRIFPVTIIRKIDSKKALDLIKKDDSEGLLKRQIREEIIEKYDKTRTHDCKDM